MINTLVIKSIRACNLRCPYCYYINEQTDRYGLAIGEEYVERLYATYSRYVSDTLKEVYLVWHGGEPLLLGRRRFQHFLDLQRNFFPPGIVRNAVQTNGVLVDDKWLDFFERNDVHVGVSLDGPQVTHDRYRVTPKGEGSYLHAVRAIKGLRQRGRAVGVISVVDGTADGAAAIDEFRRLGVEVCDFLIPMTNHARQRRTRDPGDNSSISGGINIDQVGQFLVAALKKWMEDDDPSLRIRFFEALIMNAIGVKQNFSYAGPDADCLNELVVVETDGEICLEPEYSEIDRFGFGDEYQLGLNIFREDFSFDMVEHRLRSIIADKRLGRLPEDCKPCHLRSICRGSHPGSRYDDADGSYQHRSAYCSAMQMLCAEIVRSLRRAGYSERLVDEQLRNVSTSPV